jgi:hypothetical protein
MPKNKAFGPGGDVGYGDTFTLVAPGTVTTANGQTGGRNVGYIHTLRLNRVVTAASGTTPSLTVIIEHSADNATWSTHTTFTAATAVNTERKVLSGLDRYVRARWTVSGTTPSFTWGLTGESVGGEDTD